MKITKMEKNSILKVGIIDDDYSALSIIQGSIKSLLESHKVDFIIETFTDSNKLLKDKESIIFDLLFCDIEMPNKDGIQVSFEYKEKHPDCEIIFISNREDKVFDSLKVHPFGFIRKKNFMEDIKFLLNSYFNSKQKETNKPTIVVSFGTTFYKLYLNDIIFIESKKKKQLVHVTNKDKPIEITSTLHTLQEQLEPYGFLLTHKAFLVNYKYIQDIDASYNIHLTDGSIVYLAKRKASEIKSKYLELMQNETNLIF